MKNNSLNIKFNILLLIVSNSANVFAYLFQIVMRRFLEVEAFGILTSIISLSVIFTMFFGVIPYLISKYLIEFKDDFLLSQSILIFINKITLIFIFFISLVFFSFKSFIMNFLNINDNLSIYLMLLFIITAIILNNFSGVLQGSMRYIKFAFSGTLLQLTKLLLGILIIGYLGYSYNGALFALILSNLIIIVFIYYNINDKIEVIKFTKIRIPKNISKQIFNDAIPIGLTMFLFAFLSNIDILLAKYFLSATIAGQYAAISVIAKIAIFLPATLTAVLYPQSIHDKINNKNPLISFIPILIISTLILVIFCIMVSFFSMEMINFLFGEKYIVISKYLFDISLAMSFISLSNLIFNFLLAQSKYQFIILSFFQILVIGIFLSNYANLDLSQMVNIILISSISIFATCLMYLVYSCKEYFKKEI